MENVPIFRKWIESEVDRRAEKIGFYIPALKQRWVKTQHGSRVRYSLPKEKELPMPPLGWIPLADKVLGLNGRKKI